MTLLLVQCTFKNKPFNVLVSLTYQPCNFLYDIRGYVCRRSTYFQWWNTSNSFLLEYAWDESITYFWASIVRLTQLVFHTSNTLTILSWWSSTKTYSRCLIDISANRLHMVLWMISREKGPIYIYVLTSGGHEIIYRTRYCLNAQYNASSVNKILILLPFHWPFYAWIT